ncbi:HEAT repeat domain-containing protein [Amycolatopsis sp. NPDC049691]|uniref:HEAT repeat domain-containing protein n=1 Tax=Amycolatopsis sp. NPDC049691 TaxID=3155155 RepID=UPI0034467FDB
MSDDVGSLIDRAKGADESADQAARALVARGTAALPAVIETLAESSWISPVGRLPWVVRSLHGSEAVPLLLDHIEADQRVLGESCIAALGRSHDQRAVEPLSLLLSDRDGLTTTRAHAADALGNLGSDSVTPLLQKVVVDAAAEDPEAEEWPMLVVAAAAAAAKLGDHSGFPAVARLLEVDFPPTRARAATCLQLVVGSKMLEVLDRAINDADAEVREAAVDPLFLLGTPDSIDILIEHVDDRDDNVANRIHVRIGDCLGLEGNVDAIEAEWRDLRPKLAGDVCHRLGHPVKVTELADLLSGDRRSEIAAELRTITGLEIDELVDFNRISEARTSVEALGLAPGVLHKWGRPVPPEMFSARRD